MAARKSTVSQASGFPSPFRFGFFAGIGFFCASIVMMFLSWLVVMLFIGGGIGMLMSGLRHAPAAMATTPTQQSNSVQPRR